MVWLPQGSSDTGLLFAAGKGQSSAAPAVAIYRGRLWCVWSDLDGQLWYSQTGSGVGDTIARDNGDNNGDGDSDDDDDNNTSNGSEARFAPPQRLPLSGLPVLTNLNGVLHLVVVQPATGEMAHFVHDDDDADTKWASLGPLDTGAGLVAHTTPALVAFHNKLFLAFLRDDRLYYSIWSALGGPAAQQWTPPQLVAAEDAAFRGIPALFVIDRVLHVLCGADTDERHIMGFVYDYIAQTWSQSDDVSEGRAASGVSAVSFGRSAYLGIIEAGPTDDTHAVYVAEFDGRAWAPHEAVADATAADPPQIAILNGRVHCLFNDNTATRDLRWYARPVLRYALASWMSGLPDDRLVSRLTVPGTHDSCARSSIPFVRTQYLSISQQLALGIRFFDLRLRRHKGGRLYCYHGGIPIDLPRYLSFNKVMRAIWQFLWPDAATPPTETVLVSINNDDRSQDQQDDPAVFYNAVAEAIAATPPWPATGSPRWYTEAGTPRLGDVRGRAVLLRRYAGDPAVPPTARQGLDLSGWLDDNPDFTLVTPAQVRVRLQDKWKFATRIALHDLIASKGTFVHKMMQNAAAGTGCSVRGGGDGGDDGDDDSIEVHDWYLNFCSCVGDPAEHGEIAEAKWIAVGAHSDFIGKWVTGMNVLTNEFVQTTFGGGRACLGVVNLDYPELPESNDLVARLIETNF